MAGSTPASREILEQIGSANTDAELGVLDLDVPEPVARIEDVAG